MRPFGLPQPLRSTAAALMLGAAVTSNAMAAVQPDAELQFLEQIQHAMSRDGTNALSVLGPVMRLALLYEESGDYGLAMTALERAMQIVRVNHGLRSLEQVPVLRAAIRVEEARGHHAGAWDRQQQLLALVRRYPEDLRTVSVLKEIADQQLQMLDAVLTGERPPAVVFGCYYKQWPGSGDGNCHSGTRKAIEQALLAEAHRNYAAAIATLLRNAQYESDELRALEMAILDSVEELRLRRDGPSDHPFALVPGVVRASHLEPWRSRIAPVAALADWSLPYPSDWQSAPENGHAIAKHVQMMDPYHRGRQSLRRLAAYAAASGASPKEQAAAVVQVADWDLLFSHNGEAIDAYETVYATLAQSAATDAVDELFSPAIPIVLPAFRASPLAIDETRSESGYVEVAFEITKYGRTRAIEILSSANASADALDAAVAFVRSNRFRPRLTAGRLADATPVTVRYPLYD